MTQSPHYVSLWHKIKQNKAHMCTHAHAHTHTPLSVPAIRYDKKNAKYEHMIKYININNSSISFVKANIQFPGKQ